MNDDHMTVLVERSAKELPETRVPPGLRIEGERMLLRRRLMTAGAASIAVVVVGGTAVGAVLFAQDFDRADRATMDPAATVLSVSFTPDFDPREPGVVTWNGPKGELTYIGKDAYSGSCLATGSASISRSTVRLVMTHGGTDDQICSADAVPVAATIRGLTAKPRTLIVTENDKTRSISVTTGS